MKHGLSSKARFRRGAAVLITLLVFFLAALSGTLVLTMSTSNAGRYTHEKEDQQAYLSVASAAKLILSQLDQAEIHFKSRYPTTIENPDDIDIQNDSHRDGLGLFAPTGPFGDQVLKKFAYEPGSVYEEFPFELKVKEHEEMGAVYVILLVQGGDFFFQFYLQSGESRNYQMTMRVATSFEKEGAGGNWDQDENGYYVRTLEFDVDNVTFMNELFTGGEET